MLRYTQTTKKESSSSTIASQLFRNLFSLFDSIVNTSNHIERTLRKVCAVSSPTTKDAYYHVFHLR